jgi:hypothetical protein
METCWACPLRCAGELGFVKAALILMFECAPHSRWRWDILAPRFMISEFFKVAPKGF